MTETFLGHDVFQALADPTRRRILKILAGKEMSIAQIKELFTISRTAVNKHLHILEDANTVEQRRVGRETLYTMNPTPFKDILDWISYFDEYWDTQLDRLKKIVESD